LISCEHPITQGQDQGINSDAEPIIRLPATYIGLSADTLEQFNNRWLWVNFLIDLVATPQIEVPINETVKS